MAISRSAIIYYCLEFITQNENQKNNKTYSFIIVGLLLIIAISTFLLSLYDNTLIFYQLLLGKKIRNILCGMVIRKALKKSINQEDRFSLGKMVNLASTDSLKFCECVWHLIDTLLFPFSLLVGTFILYSFIGYPSFILLACILIIVAINIGFSPI